MLRRDGGPVSRSEPALVKREGSAGKEGALVAAGSVGAAVASSACCWLPLTMLAFGASAGGASAFFERWRPYFAVGAIALLGLGFYLAYFGASACGEDGCCDARARRRLRLTRVSLWIAAVVVAAFVSFPNYVGALLDAFEGPTSEQVAAERAGERTLVFEVDGMTCEACAVTLRADLTTIEGVEAAEVDYATKSAVVRTSDPDVIDQVRDTAARHGYTATPVQELTVQTPPEGESP